MARAKQSWRGFGGFRVHPVSSSRKPALSLVSSFICWYWKVGRRVLAFALAFSFIVPTSTVFAEEAQNTEVGSSQASGETTNTNNTAASTGVLGEGFGGEGGGMMLLSSTDSGSELDIGKIPTNANLRLESNMFDGSLQYDLPLTIPPGRNGLQPTVSLHYSSRPAVETNLFGYGWSISIPYIERKNYLGVDQLYDHSAFYSSLSGDLASTSNSTVFKAKVENGDYLNYTFSGNMWTVTDRAGTTYKFGHASSTQQYTASSTQEVYKWMLQEVRDTNDNYITYSYTKDSNQIYPETITYTGNGATSGIFDIEFTKELRTDIATSSAERFQVVTKYRISEIRAEVNNSWVRKYTLGYGTADNGRRSTLTSIIETGNDGVSTVTLPTYSYAYQTSTDSWTQDTNWEGATPFVDEDYVDRGVRLGEVNGDGLPDILRNDGSNNHTLLNTGSDWVASTTISIPISFSVSGSVHPGNILADINADGLTDIAKYIENTATSTIYMGTGYGWSLSSSTVPVPFAKSNGGDNGVRVADVNGDGLPDLVRNHEGDGGTGNKIYIGNGSTWVYDSSWSLPEHTILNNNVTDPGTRVLDINGDGLADVIRRDATTNVVYLNNGHGWTVEPSWTVPIVIMDDGDDKGVRFEDVNGDGLVDLLQYNVSANVVYLNTGAGWTQDSSWSIPKKIVDTVSSVLVDAGSRFGDFNGDGLLDQVNYKQGGSSYVYLRNGNRPGLMASSTNQFGGVTTITYKTSAEFSGQNPNLPFAFDTVSNVAMSDGVTTTDVDYSYEDGRYYTTDILNRKFAGFGTVTITDALGNETKQYFHQGNTTNSGSGEYDDHISKLGKTYRTEVYDNADNLYSKSIYKWDRYDRGDGASFVKLAQAIDFSYDGDADHKEKGESYTYNDGYGNMTTKTTHGEVNGSDNGTFTDTGSDKLTFAYTYATSTATSTVYNLSQELVSDQSSNKVREKKIYYDTLSYGSLNKGNPTKEEQWKVSSTYIDTEKTYNSYGLVTQDKDARDKITTYSYDPYNLYQATTTNPLSQVIERIVGYSSGKVTYTTDANDRVFQTVYDAADRIVEEKQPDLTTPSTLVTKTAYTYTDTVFPRKVQRVDYLGTATSTDTYSYTDGFGRKLQERTEAETSNTYTVRDYRYDSRGLLTTESLPYFGTGTTYTGTSSPPTSTLLLRYTYDPLQRISASGNSVGTTTYAYDDWTVTVTDAESNDKNLTNNAYGNLIQVDEHNGASTYTTEYEYNGNSKLTKITDDGGNVRNFTYDGLGRRLTAEDLHDTGDGTYGTWTYTYDDAGNVTAQVDPKSQTINFTYDDINRVLTENYTGAGGTEIEYGYDSCADGIGRLCVATSTDAVGSYVYNALGLVATETKKVGSPAYVTQFTYDRLGNQVGITYPDNSTVTFFRNSAGLTEQVYQQESGASPEAILTDIDYAPTGKISYKEYGNGVTSTYTYDSTKLYRLQNILTSPPPAGESLMGGGGGLGYMSSMPVFATAPRLETPSRGFFSQLVLDTGEFLEGTVEMIVSTTTETIGDLLTTDETGTVSGETASTTVSDSAEAQTLPPADTATTTTEINTPTPKVLVETPQEEIIIATSTDSLIEIAEQPLPLPVDAPTLAFKVPSDQHLGLKYYEDGTVKYAYLSGIRVENIGASRETFDVARKDGIEILDEDINLRTSHARTFNTNQEGVQITEIISGEPQYYRDEKGEWWIADYATTTAESYRYQVEQEQKSKGLLDQIISFFFPQRVLADTSTFYPDPNTETSTVDGVVMRVNVQESFSTKRNSAGNSVDDSSSTHIPAQISDGTGSNWKHMTRGIFLFDTSSIPDGHTISSATFSLKRNTSTQDTYSQSVSLTSSSPASNTSLASSDYANVGTTLYATDITIASMSAGSYTDWSLNSTGIAAISKSGITKLGTRIRSDIDNSDPGSNGSNSSGSYIEVYMAEASGTSNDPKLVVVHSTIPDIPTSLLTEGAVNPTNVTDPTPELSAMNNDTDAGDAATSYQIQVATSTSFTSNYFDSGKQTLASSTAAGTRIADISYAGSPLASSTTYYWRIKFWDLSNVEGNWSTTTASFLLPSDVAAEERYQDITYTYDDVGNITNIADMSTTGTGKTLVFSYDDLYRLTTASTTAASSTPFAHTYSYTSGNLSSSTPSGAYTYGETGYANPHAATSINGTTLGYDANGNLTSYGTDLYAFDYRNRLASSTTSGTGTVNGFDHMNQRVIKTTGGISTIYPNKYFDRANATSTKYIWAGDELVATVEGNGVSTSTSYIHNDHLGSTNAVTDSNGDLTLSKDYLPFGAVRTETGDSNLARGYIGQFEEGEDMSYLNNRFYESDRGQFTSQDPVFRAVGNAEEIKRLTKVEQQKVLMDPQALNSYSYARNNPIRYSDPEGLWFGEFATGQQSWSDFQVEVGQATQQMTQDSAVWNAAVNHPYTTGAATGVVVGTGAVVAGPQILQAYGYYDTAKNVLEFREKLLVSPTKYSESEQRMAAGTVYVDALGRIVSAATPAPARQTYEALRSVLDSLAKVVKELQIAKEKQNQNQQKQQNKKNNK